MSKTNSPSRRRFLRAAGLAAAGGALAVSAPRQTSVQASKSSTAGKGKGFALQASGLPPHPNLLFILTDQERIPQHWPDGWAAANLPARQKLLADGLCFNQAYCCSSMCSPSRASLMTGLFPPQHGLVRTLTYNETALSDTEASLPSYLPNLARLLRSGGYTVALKGKWHLSKDYAGNAPGVDDVADYGYQDWEPTQAGEATSTGAFGGGCAQNDAIIVDSALQWLGQANLPEPFALFVMLANPHDVLAYPDLIADESCSPDTSYQTTADWTWGIDLPATFSEDLTANNKPSVQAASLGLYDLVLGSLDSALNYKQKQYVNFYAYLHTLADAQIDRLLGAFSGWSNARKPVIIRTADHGEMGLAHGGLRQKMFNAYEETMHVPLIIAHPDLASKGQTTEALASLVDIFATVASLANVPNKNAWPNSGVDLSPVLENPATDVQDTLLFTFDDDRAGTGWNPGFLTATPIAHHIRCVRANYNGKQWKYARYFNPAGEDAAVEEYELYDLSGDPDELHNRYNDPVYADAQVEMQARLAQAEATRLTPPRLNFLGAVRS